MTDEEFEKIARDNNFLNIHAYTEDKFMALVKAIFRKGMIEGFKLAITALEFRLYAGLEFDECDEYVNKHGKSIREVFDAIKEYEKNNTP